MKFEPGKDSGDHEQMDENEDEGEGSTGDEVKGDQKVAKGKKGYGMKKADDVDADDLQKSLDRLDDFSKSEDSQTRKDALLDKASNSDLSKSENAELFRLLGSTEEAATSSVGETVSKALTDNEPLQKSVDVSGYLQENHEALVKSLTSVGEEIEKSDSRRHNFALLQAKTLVDIGNLVKSMSETLDAISGQPVTGPKSRGLQPGQRVMEKSFGGQPPKGEQLNKSAVMDGLDDLMQESMAKGLGGRLTETNEDISLAVSKFETSGQISPTMLEAVQRLRGAGTGASH